MLNVPNYAIAVRELCEFSAKQGDLDLRFTPSPSAQEGIAGHALVQSRRGEGYEAEIALSGTWRQLAVRGRADGYDAAANRLEEIKTYHGDLGAMPDNHRQLHWAQAKIYAWLLCEQRRLDGIHVALVYFNLGSQAETMLSAWHSAADLRAYFERQCERFLGWAEQELAHRAARDTTLAALSFPHAAFRAGQRELAEAVYKSAVSGRHLLAQAPTGIGKTIGTIFPLLKACPGQQLDKLFFLAAKTSGRALALEAITKIRRDSPSLPIRVIELVARDKACAYPDRECHGDSCPLARGFYDRLPAAREDAIGAPALDKQVLHELALRHQVCPYYLAQHMVRWADVVIGDYNYFFDLHAMLHALTVNHGWRVSVLVDEAHNMVERARAMYSATLDKTSLDKVRRTTALDIKEVLNRLHRRWNAIVKEQDEQGSDYRVYPDVPAELADAVQQAISRIGSHFADHPETVDAPLREFYFDLLHFSAIAEQFGEHSLFDIVLRHPQQGGHARRQSGATSILCIRNVVPATFLASRIAATRNCVLFSATLQPEQFYRDMLGLPDAVAVGIGSPFAASQLIVKIEHRISTRYAHREKSLRPIADLIGRQFDAQPGNYLVFASSFEYLERLQQSVRDAFPAIPVFAQSREMDEASREQFLARFGEDDCAVGFAVLGGAFGEGIDLPGKRLIGAFIATLGMPQVNPVNEQIRMRMDRLFKAGYAYQYLYPGLQRVIQAAGRVIRTPQDRGILYLIDDRFSQPDIRRLLPDWWQPTPQSQPLVRARSF